MIFRDSMLSCLSFLLSLPFSHRREKQRPFLPIYENMMKRRATRAASLDRPFSCSWYLASSVTHRWWR